jgi:hypothetical protein
MTTTMSPPKRDTTKARQLAILSRKRRMFERWAKEMRQFGIQVEIPAELAPPTEAK